MSGSVYFLECAGRIKIGHSIDVPKRVRELSCGAPEKPVLIGTVEGPIDLERALHKKLKSHRHHREWFADCPEVRAVIAELLRDGAGAIAFTPRETKKWGRPPVTRGEPVELPLSTVSDPWIGMAKNLTKLLNSYELSFEYMPRHQALAIVRRLARANDEFGETLNFVARNDWFENPKMEADASRWFAGLECELRALAAPVNAGG